MRSTTRLSGADRRARWKATASDRDDEWQPTRARAREIASIVHRAKESTNAQRRKRWGMYRDDRLRGWFDTFYEGVPDFSRVGCPEPLHVAAIPSDTDEVTADDTVTVPVVEADDDIPIPPDPIVTTVTAPHGPTAPGVTPVTA